jgi:hypothetical protein
MCFDTFIIFFLEELINASFGKGLTFPFPRKYKYIDLMKSFQWEGGCPLANISKN